MSGKDLDSGAPAKCGNAKSMSGVLISVLSIKFLDVLYGYYVLVQYAQALVRTFH